jgi:hypothetical protein
VIVKEQPKSRAEILRELAANAGRVPGCDTPEQLAAFVEGAHRKGQAPAASPAAGPDMNTPEGVAAFVLAAGKPRATK